MRRYTPPHHNHFHQSGSQSQKMQSQLTGAAFRIFRSQFSNLQRPQRGSEMGRPIVLGISHQSNGGAGAPRSIDFFVGPQGGAASRQSTSIVILAVGLSLVALTETMPSEICVTSRPPIVLPGIAGWPSIQIFVVHGC